MIRECLCLVSSLMQGCVRVSSIQLSMFCSQGQDDPLTYTNHTCEVWSESRKRSQTSNNSDSTHNPAKRKREQTNSDLVDMCATSKKLAKLSDAAAPKTPPAATPRINPIDHIFQFHKVNSILNGHALLQSHITRVVHVVSPQSSPMQTSRAVHQL